MVDSIRLRSVVGERGKWSGGRREVSSGTKLERNAAAEPQTEARVCGAGKIPLVTSARFA